MRWVRRPGARFAEWLPAVASCQSLLARWAEARSVFFSLPLDLTTPLRADPELRPHPIDLTHADSNAKGGLEFSLDAARSNLWVGGAELGEPRSRWFDQLVRMAMAIIQQS